MTTPREAVYAAIDSERDYQQLVWNGLKNHEADNPLTSGEFLTLLRVYLRKAEEAWAIEEKPEVNTLDVVRKIAGIAVNCMEQHGAPKRNFPAKGYIKLR
jgi:hypothetical protein